MDTTSTRPLQTALGANGAFSLATGALLAAVPGTVAGWLAVEIDGWLRLLGVALIGHAALLGWAAGRPDPKPWTKVNLAAIAPYPLLMVLLVALGLVDTRFGRVLLLLDGAIVGVIALLHLKALRPQESLQDADTPVHA